MATTTPNYGWPVPTSTDYVKDGATAIEALGDAIDATVFGLGSAGISQIVPTSITKGASGTASASATGLVTFTGTESIALDGVFSSTYKNYKLIVNLSNNSATGAINFRFRTGGTDNSSNLYITSTIGTSSWGSASVIGAVDPKTSADFSYAAAGSNTVAEYDYFSPFESVRTFGYGVPMSQTEPRWRALIFDGTTSFDGLKLYAGSGTITGVAQVYGYRVS